MSGESGFRAVAAWAVAPRDAAGARVAHLSRANAVDLSDDFGFFAVERGGVLS